MERKKTAFLHAHAVQLLLWTWYPADYNERTENIFLPRRGDGTVEIILIIVVLVGLVVIFRKQLNDLVTRIFSQINADSSSILG